MAPRKKTLCTLIKAIHLNLKPNIKTILALKIQIQPTTRLNMTKPTGQPIAAIHRFNLNLETFLANKEFLRSSIFVVRVHRAQ
jgi:hypothetical protein